MNFKEETQKIMTSSGLLILRIIFGGSMLLAHGLPKLQNFSEKSATFPNPLGLGSELSLSLVIGAEVFCALFLIFGILTRWVCIPLLFTMLVGLYLHIGVWNQSLFDAPGKPSGELAFIYGFAYVAIFLLGAGKFSLDSYICKKWNKSQK